MDNMLNIIRDIIERKRAQRRLPDIAHFREIMDYIAPGQWKACEARLRQLHRIGLIHIGPTRMGDYASLKTYVPILDKKIRDTVQKQGCPVPYLQNTTIKNKTRL